MVEIITILLHHSLSSWSVAIWNGNVEFIKLFFNLFINIAKFVCFYSSVIILYPLITIMFWVLPKIKFSAISWTHSDSRYIAPFNIVDLIFIAIILIYTLSLMRVCCYRYKAHQKICSYLNLWTKAVKETVYLILTWLFICFCYVCSGREDLSLFIVTVEEDNSSPTVHHRTYFPF
jgi:hypothetical protein